MDRGEFFHNIYRIEQKLGRAFAELKPFPLYPLDEYFGGMAHKLETSATSARELAAHFRLPLSA